MFVGWNQQAFLMSCIAGLSTGLGGLLVLFYGTPSAAKLGHLLSFSAGVMLYISFMDLLPEAAEGIGFVKANIAFFSGMIFFAVLAKLIPEDVGGHSHDHGEHSASEISAPSASDLSSPRRSSRSRSSKRDEAAIDESDAAQAKAKSKEEKKARAEKELKRVGLITALGISIHNFPEGIAVYLACMKGMDVGLPIALAIGAHNIPEGMAVASPIYHSTGSKWEAFKFSILSGLCEPLAALLFSAFFSQYMTDEIVQLLLAGVAGIMVLVSLKELLPTALKYISADTAMISNALGMAFIGMSIYYLHQSGGHDHTHAHDHSHAHDHAHAHAHHHHDDHAHAHAHHHHEHNHVHAH